MCLINALFNNDGITSLDFDVEEIRFWNTKILHLRTVVKGVNSSPISPDHMHRLGTPVEKFEIKTRKYFVFLGLWIETVNLQLCVRKPNL